MKATRRQAFAAVPVVKASLLVTLESPVGSAADARLAVNFQNHVQQPRYHHPQYGHTQCWCLYFFPAWLPLKETRSPTMTGTCGAASLPMSLPDSPLTLP